MNSLNFSNLNRYLQKTKVFPKIRGVYFFGDRNYNYISIL